MQNEKPARWSGVELRPWVSRQLMFWGETSFCTRARLPFLAASSKAASPISRNTIQSKLFVTWQVSRHCGIPSHSFPQLCALTIWSAHAAVTDTLLNYYWRRFCKGWKKPRFWGKVFRCSQFLGFLSFSVQRIPLDTNFTTQKAHTMYHSPHHIFFCRVNDVMSEVINHD